jgi:Mn2+/Fe2+ NRAMP family transporter
MEYPLSNFAFVTAAFAIFAVVTLTSAIFAVVTLASAIFAVVVSICNFGCSQLKRQLQYQRLRIVPSKIFAVVTASAAISAARIVPSKSCSRYSISCDG